MVFCTPVFPRLSRECNSRPPLSAFFARARAHRNSLKRADFEDTELDGKENISKVMNWVSLAHAEIMDSLSGSGRAASMPAGIVSKGARRAPSTRAARD